MKFLKGNSMIVFDFVYGRYVVSVADYLDKDGNPEDKTTVMILLNGNSIKSLERIAKYIDSEIEGTAVDNGSGCIDISIQDHDQIMNALLAAIRIYL